MEILKSDPTLARILKGLKFPANKNKVVGFVREIGGYEELVAILKNIPNVTYSNPTEVANALRKTEDKIETKKEKEP